MLARSSTALAVFLFVTAAPLFAADKDHKPIRALLITGGCCHDYTMQKEIITRGISARARVVWTVIQQGGKTTNTKIPAYENGDWAKDFDVVVHNECFAGVTDPKWTERILKPHREGLPALVIHCAMHSYRDKTDEWFKFCGVTSHRHGAHYSYQVHNISKNDPIMATFGDKWDTPKGELYLISKLWDNAKPLAHARSRDTKKDEVCVWTNTYGKGRVFGTTIGHHNETMMDPVYLNMLTRGLLWSVGKLDDEHFTRVDTAPLLPKKPEGPQPTPAKRLGAKPGSLVPNNLALKKPTTASSSQSARDAKFATDGDYNTRWCGNGGNPGHSVQVDLGKPEKITGCRIVWEFDGKLYQYRVEGSRDGKEWQMLVDRTKEDKQEQVHTHKFAADGIQHVRVTTTKTSSGAWTSLWELEVFGTEMVKATKSIPKQKKNAGQGNVLSRVKIPDGFQATEFVSPPDINYPTCIAAAPNGDVFVGVDQNGSLGKDKTKVQRVVRCIDTDNDGTADKINVFADKVGSVRGMFFDNNSLWVLHPPLLRVFHDDDGDGKADRDETLIEGLGTPALAQRGADHCTNGFRLGIDGWIYIAVGDFGFTKATGKDGTELQLHGGGIVRVRPDGTGLEVYARGLRNIYDVAVSPKLDVFTRDNTNDGGGWNVRLSYIIPTGHYGYPSLFKNFPEYMIQPLADYGGGSPTGSLYVDEPGMPEGMGRALYTCDWGRNVIYRHPLEANGAGYTAKQESFVELPRPTDMDIDGQGRMYIASWHNGSFAYKSPDVGFVVRVTPTDLADPAPFPNLNKVSPAELVKLIGSESHIHRHHAQLAILRRSQDPATISGLQTIARNHKRIESRIAAIFTLKQWLGDGSHEFLVELTSDATIREYALRALADHRGQVANVPVKPFLAGMADKNPRVRLQAAVGLERLGSKTKAAVRGLVSESGSSDPLVQHAATNALVGLAPVRELLVHVDKTDGAARSGAIRALSQIHDVEVVNGLAQRQLASQDPDLTKEILVALCRLYHREKPWTGSWWSTRPDTSGPYYYHETWGGSARIEAVLRRAAATADDQIASLLARELPRHKIKLSGLKFKADALDPAILLGLPSHSAEELQQIEKLAKAKDQEMQLRVRAFDILRNSDGVSIETLTHLILEIAGNEKLNAQQLLARQSFIYDPRNAESLTTFVDMSSSDDEPARKLAFTVLLGQLSSTLVDDDRKQQIRNHLDEAWKEEFRAPSLLDAIAEMGAEGFESKIEESKQSTLAATKSAAARAAQALAIINKDRNAPRLKGAQVANVVKELESMKGDVALGARLFVRQQCIACHTISSTQKPVGPFLGDITKRYKRHEVIESIMTPDAKIAQGFTTQFFITDNGKSYTGFVVRESADRVELRDAQGKRVFINKDEIDERGTQKTSMMPKGLVDQLTARQFASLLAYLQSLK